jgi:hypothetical protein
MNTSAQSNMNSPYILTGVTDVSNFSSAGTIWCNDLVIQGSLTTTGAVVFGSTVSITGTLSAGVIASSSAASFGAITGTTGTLTSTLTVGGKVTATSLISAMAGVDASAGTQALFYSYHTIASATSAILPDGALGIYFHSGNSCRLCFRSGATTYTIIATTGAVL